MVVQNLERESRAKAGPVLRKLVEAVEADNDIALAVCARADIELWLLREVARVLLAGDREALASLRDAFADADAATGSL